MREIDKICQKAKLSQTAKTTLEGDIYNDPMQELPIMMKHCAYFDIV